MKTYSSYVAIHESNIVAESNISTLSAIDSGKFDALPACPKTDAEFAAAAKACSGYKNLERKVKAIGCSLKHPYIVLNKLQNRIGGYSDLEIVPPRESKTHFWFRVDSRGALTGFKENFLRLSMYAQIQPELYGKDLDDAVKELVKVKEFVQWFNAQDLASILPLFKEKG